MPERPDHHVSGTAARVHHEPLHELLEEIFRAVGLAEGDATTVAGHLVKADLRGVGSHGVSRTAIYVSRIRQGLVEPRPRMTQLRASAVSALLDGDNGPGIVVAKEATRIAIAKATESGIGAVGVRGSNHCGMLADYTSMMSAHGLIGLATTSAPSSMVPCGGVSPFFGTNPLSYAIPMPGGSPDVVLDMATSTVARGKIIQAQQAGEPIPLGWAVDIDGAPTEDSTAALAGSMLPVGDHKGSGLAMLVDILSGLLPEANYGPHIPQLYDRGDLPQNLGHFFLALRPDLFTSGEELSARMQSMADELRALPTAPGHSRVRLPGEPEVECAAAHREHGIPLSLPVRAELARLAAGLDIDDERTECLAVPGTRDGIPSL